MAQLPLNFKEWIVFLEGSFTQEDIPDFFYVGCRFSEDFAKHYSFTPSGAACSLVGLEGITTKENTAINFGKNTNGAILKMPGKAVVDLNKLSKSMYDNPHYMTSSGFRAPRRLKAGKGYGNYGKRDNSTESLMTDVVNHVIGSMRNLFPDIVDFGLIKTPKGDTFNTKQIVELLKNVRSRKGDFWGSRADNFRPPLSHKYKRNFKPHRARHRENPLKNLQNADELAKRLMVVFRSLLGDETATKFLGDSRSTPVDRSAMRPVMARLRNKGWKQQFKPSAGEHAGLPVFANGGKKIVVCGDGSIQKYHQKSPIPLIAQWVRSAAKSTGSGYSHEDEWVTKRQPVPGVSGIYCPNCDKFSEVKPDFVGKTIKCWNCWTNIEVTADKVRHGELPCLHVPDGSTLVLKEDFPDWGRKYIQNYEDFSEKKQIEMLLDKIQLYKKLNIYIKPDLNDSSFDNSVMPYDPERYDTQEDIKKALVGRKDVPVGLLEKLMSHKGLAPAKLKEILNRWEKAGVLKSHDGKLTLVDANFDENSLLVYDIIKNNDSLSTQTLLRKTGLSNGDLKVALDNLLQKNKIQLMPNGEYDIKLSDKEMNELTEDEHKILEAIRDVKKRFNGPYDFEMPAPLVKKVLKSLKRKRKIFTSPLSGAFRVVLNGDEPLSKEETKLLKHLKQWPSSDLFTLRKVFKNDRNILDAALDNLLARDMISVSENKDIILNKEKFTDYNTAAKEHSKAAQAVLTIVGNHFIAKYNNIMAFKPKWESSETERFLEKLFHSGLIKNTGGRIIPTDSSYLKPKTPEESIVLKLADKKEYFTDKDVRAAIARYNKDLADDVYYAINLIRHLVDENSIRGTYDPVKETTFYHATHKSYSIKSDNYEKAIVKILKQAKKPVEVSYIREKIDKLEENRRNRKDKYFKQLSHDALIYILDEMTKKSDPKITYQMDVGGHERLYYLVGSKGPRTKESYFDDVKKILEKGPITDNVMHDRLREDLGLNYYGADAVIKAMVDEGIVMMTFSDLSDNYIVHLPGQKLPSWDDYEAPVLKIIEQGPIKRVDLVHKLDAQKINISSSIISKILAHLVDESKILKSIDYTGSYVYHLAGHDHNAELNKKLTDDVMKIIASSPNNEVKIGDLYFFPSVKQISWSDLREFIGYLVNQKIVYLKTGDVDGIVSDTILTTTPVDSDLIKYQVVMDTLSSKSVCTLYQLSAELSNNGFDNSEGVRAFLVKMLETGKIHIVKPNSDFWQQQVSAGPTPTQVAPVPQSQTAPQAK